VWQKFNFGTHASWACRRVGEAYLDCHRRASSADFIETTESAPTASLNANGGDDKARKGAGGKKPPVEGNKAND
jgi:hypothetical protein